MKFGVLVFPGSNCDDDMVHVLGTVMKQNVVKVWHKDIKLEDDIDCVIVPGGFSYGDYLRCGAIAKFSPIMHSVIDFANNGGLVLGICNGFQILCEAGLLPGVLLRNKDMLFICKNIYLKPSTLDSFLTNELEQDKTYKIPIAHAEGRYYADAKTLKSLEENNQIIFKYCTANGVINEASNPNGATNNIAGICNEKRNVIGLMPHPERASESILGNIDGFKMFQSVIKHFESVLA
jgi:phosphoribosylformylglycinamidine synthase subunit PurQ / glutaminase